VIPSTPLQASPELLILVVIMAVFLGMMIWTYTDAKRNSEHPAFLWAIVVFLAPVLGIVVYLLVGRNSRGGGSRGQYS